MSGVDVDALRKLAEAATPEWEAWWTLENGQFEVYVPNGTMSTETVLRFCDHLDCEECARPSEADAAFIAAANPSAVLALLDEVERLRATVARAQLLCATWQGDGIGTDRYCAAELRAALETP